MNVRLSPREVQIAVAGLELAAWAVAPPACGDCDFSDSVGAGPCPAHAEAVEASADYLELAGALRARLPAAGQRLPAPGG